MCSLERQIDEAIWVAGALFESGEVTGSTGNISFRYKNSVYMSVTDSCFGRLQPISFTCMDLAGHRFDDRKPSKEYPLHLALYAAHRDVGAVIHTHGFNATVWSSLPHRDPLDAVPEYTPYLKMKLGRIRLIDYAAPGSDALFETFRQALGPGNGYLLAHHGSLVGGKDMLAAFYATEELEQGCRVALSLDGTVSPTIGA